MTALPWSGITAASQYLSVKPIQPPVLPKRCRAGLGDVAEIAVIVGGAVEHADRADMHRPAVEIALRYADARLTSE